MNVPAQIRSVISIALALLLLLAVVAPACGEPSDQTLDSYTSTIAVADEHGGGDVEECDPTLSSGILTPLAAELPAFASLAPPAAQTLLALEPFSAPGATVAQSPTPVSRLTPLRI